MVTSRKGALLRQAGALHLSGAPLVSPPLCGHRLGRGKERPHPRAVLSPQRRRHGSTAARTPARAPGSESFRSRSGWSGGRWSFALSSGAQTPGRLPKPGCARPMRSPPPPAACRGRQGAPGRRVSFPQLRSPKTAAPGFRRELAGWGLDGAGFTPEPFPPLAATPSPAASLCSEYSGVWGGRWREGVLPRLPPNPNPCSLQRPGEGSSAFQQSLPSG